jgi:MoaA/NifB/PqqE/SkfB family radical SAM enzyme
MAFMAYTNGTLIDEKMADQLQAVGNVSPAISLEGWREHTDARRGAGVFDRVVNALDRLRERGIAFGISLTIDRNNMEEVTSDAFIDFLMEKGALYGWSFHYIPVGSDPNPELMVTAEQRAYLVHRIHYIRNMIGFQIADFWNDGDLTQGCLAGGRRYFHINASGAVEPCAFVHVTLENIREKSLVEVLQSPLFTAFQRQQPFSDNLLRACPIIDVPGALRDIVKETGAKPSHKGADDVLQGGLADFLDAHALRWQETADVIWEERHPAEKVEVSIGK